jgi:hypothetical protein
MSAAFFHPEPTFQPDPDQADDHAPAPHRFAGLLRRVFDYGKQLIVAVRLRSACPEFPRLAKPFGTTDLWRILARISAAMGRALLLEERFLRNAGLGRHARPQSLRAQATRRPAGCPAARGPRRLTSLPAGRTIRWSPLPCSSPWSCAAA